MRQDLLPTFRRVRWRFSLLSLLLFVSLLCTSVSHVRTSIELSRLEDQYRTLDRTVRIHNNELGFLTVDNPEQVHLISRRRPFVYRPGAPDFGWEIYLPQGHRWRLHWSVGQIPMDGVSEQSSGSTMLIADGDGKSHLLVQLNPGAPPKGLATKLVLRFHNFADHWEYQATPMEISHALRPSGELQQEIAGEDANGRPATASFNANEPVVILRSRGINSPGQDNRIGPGFMLWIERADQ